ncbi:MAG: N-methyl-L-tryptophan oxidase [Fimbriimonadales bacterium]
MRVAVVGLGAVGAAALYHLAKQGIEAVGYEQFEVGHTRGSSHGASRIYRLTYADPTYTQMMKEALPLWQTLQAEAGEELIVPCGVLWIGAEDDAELNAIRTTLQQAGVSYEWLTPEAVQARFPAFRLHPSERALFQAEGGFLRADACVRACVRLAQRYGAQVHAPMRLHGWRSESNGIVLEFKSGHAERFDGVVLTLGGWLPKWVSEVAPQLRVTRQVYAYFPIRGEPSHFMPERHPVWIEATAHFYGFPHEGVQPGVKIAQHKPGEPHDPDMVARAPDERDLAPLQQAIARRFPDLGTEALSAHTCLYTSTPDERFVIQPLAGEPRTWYASACSGHGFKFAILNGKRVAEGVIATILKPS